jgi:hypothetical protein
MRNKTGQRKTPEKWQTGFQFVRRLGSLNITELEEGVFKDNKYLTFMWVQWVY